MTYLLAQASAHRIPLRDGSVQTCVTSPPYWGLRAYAGEQTFSWGGDVGHAHEWGGERIATAGRNDSGEQREGFHGQAAGYGGARNVSQGSFCPCGAWRGALGLEPTPELYVEHMVEVFREVRRVLRKEARSGSTSETVMRVALLASATVVAHMRASAIGETFRARSAPSLATSNPKTSSASPGASPSRCRRTAGGCARTSSGPSQTRCPRA